MDINGRNKLKNGCALRALVPLDIIPKNLTLAMKASNLLETMEKANHVSQNHTRQCSRVRMRKQPKRLNPIKLFLQCTAWVGHWSAISKK
jgi:hypothetical protein